MAAASAVDEDSDYARNIECHDDSTRPGIAESKCKSCDCECCEHNERACKNTQTGLPDTLAFDTVPVRRLLLSHLQDAVSGSRKHRFVLLEYGWQRQRAAERSFNLNLGGLRLLIGRLGAHMLTSGSLGR